MAEVTKLGQVFEDFQPRDAVHVAVASVTAVHRVYPGEHVGLFDEHTVSAKMSDVKEKIGIVDPFLTHYVEPGDIFWLFLYPQTITSLRHNWTHPAFEEKEIETDTPVVTLSKEDAKKQESVQWVKDYADRVGLSYSQLINGAKEYISYGEYMNYGSLLEGEYIPDEFWGHYQIITDEIVSEDRQHNFFSCSC